MTDIDELAATVQELKAKVTWLQKTPVSATARWPAPTAARN